MALVRVNNKDKHEVKYAPKRLMCLLGTSLILGQFPVGLHAADTTGWDCTRLANGSWKCNAGVPTPVAPPVEAPKLISKPTGPITPPASSLPVTPEPESAPAVAKPVPVPEPEAEPEPATPVVATPTPEPEATPVPDKEPVITKPEPRPVKEAPVVAKPEPEPAPKTKPATVAVDKRQIGGGGPWALCPPVERPATRKYSATERANSEINLSADSADLNREGQSTFKGNVVVTRADQRLVADTINYDKEAEHAEAKGNATLSDNSIAIRGDEIKLDFKRDKTTVTNANFDLYDRHGRGTSEKLRHNSTKNTTRLENTTYTSCPVGNDDWYLNADKIKLDHDEGIGLARNVSVNFMGIPFFYAPVMTFPIDDRRKSGFLSPSFGSTDESGAEFSIPYYWNIAPNRDATFAPRYLGKRGLQLRGEYRYLSKKGNGIFSAEYLPSDNQYNNDDRYLLTYKNNTALTPRLSVSANLNDVSDRDYLEDLGTSINVTSITHLERTLRANYSGDFWSVSGTLQGYQTVDKTIAGTSRPYNRLPQIIFDARLPNQPYGLNFDVRAEAVYFDRADSVTGSRFDILPGVSLPLRNSYAFVTPRVALRYTKYDLNNTLAGTNSSPDRSVPIFSIDSGMFFDRDTTIAGRSMTQTLEPRLYYLNVPRRSQNNLIIDESGRSVVFDSGLFDFSFDQLFRENRFSGADRIGDANQLTAAVTTRFIDKTSGIERAKASIGQIFYFQDREVTLPNGPVENDNTSDIVAEVSARFTRSLSARAGIQYDPNTSETEKGVASIRYQSADNHIVNFSYRQRENLLEQTDFSFNWPISRQWNAVGRWNYSLDRERTIDAFAGLEYENCCWAARIIGREYVNDLSQANENFALMFQLELKGLSNFGDKLKKFLGRSILGYDRQSVSNNDIF